MDEKTNVMRILDKKKVKYNNYCYAHTDAISGVDVAKVLNQDPRKVFKTLVTIGKLKNYYVFVIPVEKELDLKKAAKSVNEKSIEMIKSKDLLTISILFIFGPQFFNNYTTYVYVSKIKIDNICKKTFILQLNH